MGRVATRPVGPAWFHAAHDASAAGSEAPARPPLADSVALDAAALGILAAVTGARASGNEEIVHARAHVIERILPDEVASVEAFDDPPDAVLYPGEAEVISRAVDKRRREFRTVRHCARRALRQLGLPPAPVLRGEHGEPQWPPSVVGSMTHCSGYRAAAVAHSCDLRTLGIDAEPHQPLPTGVLDIIARDEERDSLSDLAAVDSATCWDRILFCAKETVYKAWFPLTHRWLGFDAAAVTITPGTTDPAQGSFSARLLVPGPTINGDTLTRWDGRWLRSDELIITAIALPAWLR